MENIIVRKFDRKDEKDGTFQCDSVFRTFIR